MLRLAATVMKTKINVLAVFLARDQYLKLSSVLIAIAIDQQNTFQLPPYINKIPSNYHHTSTKYHHIVPNKIPPHVNKIPSFCFLQNTQSQNTLLHSCTPSCCEPLVVFTFPPCREKTTHPQKSLSRPSTD
jgi:hypothetical protein